MSYTHATLFHAKVASGQGHKELLIAKTPEGRHFLMGNSLPKSLGMLGNAHIYSGKFHTLSENELSTIKIMPGVTTPIVLAS